MTNCTGCGKPEPNDWCWDGRLLDCPAGKPPRHLGVLDLWKCLVEQEKRIAALE